MRSVDLPIADGEQSPRPAFGVRLGADPAPPALHGLALEALAQTQAALRSNTALAQQSATLEEQVQLLLAERIALIERIELLEAQLAGRSPQAAGGPERQPILFRPLANLPAALHRDRLEAITLTRHSARAVVSDEEVLLGTSADGASPSTPARASGSDAPPMQGYTLTARPFARFTDLGGFQEAVQALPGIRNVRVRRFAQATLEMRLDYDGARPLTDLLRGLELPIEEVVQEGPARLALRLVDLDERNPPDLS